MHRSHSGDGDFHRICSSLLPIADDAQVRGNSVRYQRAGAAQRTNGARPHGAPSEQRTELFGRRNRLEFTFFVIKKSNLMNLRS